MDLLIWMDILTYRCRTWGLSDVYKKLNHQMQGSIADVQASGEPCTDHKMIESQPLLENNQLKNNFPSRVIIKGDTWVSKTTICNKICLDWAKEDVDSPYLTHKLLFMIPKGEYNTKGKDLVDLYNEAVPSDMKLSEEQSKHVRNFMQCHVGSTCFILDGCDKYLNTNVDIFSNSMGACVTMTTEPNAAMLKPLWEEACCVLLHTPNYTNKNDNSAWKYAMDYLTADQIYEQVALGHIFQFNHEHKLEYLTSSSDNLNLLCFVMATAKNTLSDSQTDIMVKVVSTLMGENALNLEIIPDVINTMIEEHMMKMGEAIFQNKLHLSKHDTSRSDDTQMLQSTNQDDTEGEKKPNVYLSLWNIESGSFVELEEIMAALYLVKQKECELDRGSLPGHVLQGRLALYICGFKSKRAMPVLDFLLIQNGYIIDKHWIECLQEARDNCILEKVRGKLSSQRVTIGLYRDTFENIILTKASKLTINISGTSVWGIQSFLELIKYDQQKVPWQLNCVSFSIQSCAVTLRAVECSLKPMNSGILKRSLETLMAACIKALSVSFTVCGQESSKLVLNVGEDFNLNKLTTFILPTITLDLLVQGSTCKYFSHNAVIKVPNCARFLHMKLCFSDQVNLINVYIAKCSVTMLLLESEGQCQLRLSEYQLSSLRYVCHMGSGLTSTEEKTLIGHLNENHMKCLLVALVNDGGISLRRNAVQKLCNKMMLFGVLYTDQHRERMEDSCLVEVCKYRGHFTINNQRASPVQADVKTLEVCDLLHGALIEAEKANNEQKGEIECLATFLDYIVNTFVNCQQRLWLKIWCHDQVKHAIKTLGISFELPYTNTDVQPHDEDTDQNGTSQGMNSTNPCAPSLGTNTDVQPHDEDTDQNGTSQGMNSTNPCPPSLGTNTDVQPHDEDTDQNGTSQRMNSTNLGAPSLCTNTDSHTT